jgi:hypothetical protein
MKQLYIKKISLTFITLLAPLLLNSQTQIGSDIDGEVGIDLSGHSISLSSDGNILVIGAPFNDGNGKDSGHVRVYRNNNGSWEQIGTDINGEAVGDGSGWSVSISSNGSIIAIGAPFNDGNGINSGHVRVYNNNNNNNSVWEQVGNDINAEAAGDRFGESVSLSSDGTIVAIGAIYNNDGNGINSGHVRVYRNNNNNNNNNNNGNWEQIGSDIDGEEARDGSGWAISLSSDGSILAVGATGSNGTDGQGDSGLSGYVRIYKNNNEVWEQLGHNINGEAIGDYSGHSISLSSDGNILVIGAPFNDGNGNSSGHVRVYRNNNGVWEQIGSDIDGEAAEAQSGNSVSLSSDGSIVAIGAIKSDGGITERKPGHVRIYRNNNGSWEQIGKDIDGEGDYNNFGSSVSLSTNGNIVAIGAPYNNGTNEDSGHVRVYNLSTALKTSNFLLSKFSVFPNPVKNFFTIQLKENIQLKKVSIYNSLGQFIKSSKELSINTSNLTKGIYVLKIETDIGTASKKLVIK